MFSDVCVHSAPLSNYQDVTRLMVRMTDEGETESRRFSRLVMKTSVVARRKKLGNVRCRTVKMGSIGLPKHRMFHWDARYASRSHAHTYSSLGPLVRTFNN